MNADDLRALQTPIKDRYRDHPSSAMLTLRSRGLLGEESISCRVETGRAIVEAGIHPAAGGDGLMACSGEMLLEALVACAGVTLRAVATAIGVEVRGGTVTAEGDLDFRGTMGVDKSAPVGFAAIRLRLDLDTTADPATLATLQRLTERYCVIYQSLAKPPAITCVITNPPPTR